MAGSSTDKSFVPWHGDSSSDSEAPRGFNPITGTPDVDEELSRVPEPRVTWPENQQGPGISLPVSATVGSTCQDILSHCRSEIDRFIESLGNQVCVFKIGISRDLPNRFQMYEKEGYTHMTGLHVTNQLPLVEMLEAALIMLYRERRGCRNVALGGEGMRGRNLSQPFYCYVAGARADRMSWIGN
jgi:hypothetical protein